MAGEGQGANAAVALAQSLEPSTPQIKGTNGLDGLLAQEPLARFPLAWNHASDEKSRQIKNLKRILIAKVGQFLRNAL